MLDENWYDLIFLFTKNKQKLWRVKIFVLQSLKVFG